ncbi:MAG: hypothetical protein VX181_06330 [Pseudomonadota bacterium]|nr:hypothetical protein [Pseudomonadota bacterium]
MAGLTAGMERGRMLAARALQDGDKDGAMGHIGEMLHAYGTLDEQLREELGPLMRELTGVAMAITAVTTAGMGRNSCDGRRQPHLPL